MKIVICLMLFVNAMLQFRTLLMTWLKERMRKSMQSYLVYSSFSFSSFCAHGFCCFSHVCQKLFFLPSEFSNSQIFHFLIFSLFIYRVIHDIFDIVDKHIAADKLITGLNMSALPSLYDYFVKLLRFLVCIFNLSILTCILSSVFLRFILVVQFLSLQMDNKKEDRGQVVILFQDMLEVVTRDIMEDQLSRYRSSIFYLLKFVFNAIK